MAEKIERLDVNFDLWLEDGKLTSCSVGYSPESARLGHHYLSTTFTISPEEMDQHLRKRLERVIAFMTARIGQMQFEFEGRKGSLGTTLARIHCFGKNGDVAASPAGTSVSSFGLTPRGELTEAQRRLLDSVLASFDKLSWGHLARRLNASPTARPDEEVFVSYRSTKQDFAEAIAARLGREGITPFFDKWDIKAGDSIAGKIENAFARSAATVIVLSNDFKLGQWATAEMETAVTKRIQEGHKVIPVLYEKCDVPELLKPLRHVDFSSHDPQTFESKFGELIDAIYSLEQNPFRS